MKTGIQVSSLKPLLCTPAQVRMTFSEMARQGWDMVQLQWIDPAVSVEEIAAALGDTGLQSVSVQDFYETVKDNLEYYVNLNAATGGTWLCVSRIPERCKFREGLDLFAAELRELSACLEGLGQKLCFHPVSADYRAVAGMDPVGYLLEALPELDICLDLYHLNKNCTDMPGFIRKYGKRICMVHFKDEKDGHLVPAGQGQTNWAGVTEACLEAGVSYGFAEQETWDRDPYDCLREAMDWLDREIKKASPPPA